MMDKTKTMSDKQLARELWHLFAVATKGGEPDLLDALAKARELLAAPVACEPLSKSQIEAVLNRWAAMHREDAGLRKLAEMAAEAQLAKVRPVVLLLLTTEEWRDACKKAERELAAARDELTAVKLERDRLRGIRPELPPLPPYGDGMPRYGIRWNGPESPLAVPMDDGYWTPFHLAQAERDELTAVRLSFHERGMEITRLRREKDGMLTQLEASTKRIAELEAACVENKNPVALPEVGERIEVQTGVNEWTPDIVKATYREPAREAHDWLDTVRGFTFRADWHGRSWRRIPQPKTVRYASGSSPIQAIHNVICANAYEVREQAEAMTYEGEDLYEVTLTARKCEKQPETKETGK